MDPKSLRRIRTENIKRLEESLPPLAEKIARADLEHKFCPKANPETGVCDAPEKRAQQFVMKFVQEHRNSSLIVSSSTVSKDTNPFKGAGDQKAKKKKQEADDAATKAREKIINDLEEEKQRLEDEYNTVQEFIGAVQEVLGDFPLSSSDEENDDA